MTIKALYPTIRPTLDLNFARTKALDPRITFTRASAGTFIGSDGLIQSAAAGQARFDHNPLTGQSLGLLVEEARTNSLWPSEPTTATLRNTAGGPGNDWFVYDATVSPATRNRITGLEVTIGTSLDNNGYQANFGGIGGGGTFSGATTASLSFFIHPLTWTANITVKKLPTDGNPTTGGFTELFNGGVYTGPASFVKAIFPDGTYWLHNIAWTDLSTNTAAAQFPLILTTTPGDNIKKFWAGGFQWEAGAFSTSYIPTTGATVTRAEELVSILGSNFTSFYSPNKGTFFVQASITGERNDTSGSALVSLGTTNNDTFASFFLYDNRLDVGILRPSQANVAQLGNLTGKLLKGATGFDDALTSNAASASAINGSLYNVNLTDNYAVSSTPAAVGGYDRLGIGRTIRSITTYDSINGTIARLTYWPTRLPIAQLQALTQ